MTNSLAAALMRATLFAGGTSATRPCQIAQSFLVRPLHFVLYAVRQLFDFFCFLQHINRKDVLIRFVHVLFQLPGQLHQFVGVGLKRRLSFHVGSLGHFADEPITALPALRRCDSAVDPQRWALAVLSCPGYREPQEKKQTPSQRFRSHGVLETDAIVLPVPKVWPLFQESATKNLRGIRDVGGDCGARVGP